MLHKCITKRKLSNKELKTFIVKNQLFFFDNMVLLHKVITITPIHPLPSFSNKLKIWRGSFFPYTSTNNIIDIK